MIVEVITDNKINRNALSDLKKLFPELDSIVLNNPMALIRYGASLITINKKTIRITINSNQLFKLNPPHYDYEGLLSFPEL